VISEPEMTETIKGYMKEAEIKARGFGHELGEWKWDGYGTWRAWCQYRNCHASAWVSPNNPSQPYGGNAIF